MEFRHCNCIVVFDKEKERILFCRRAKNPYKGLYNFVGGKVEPDEHGENAAYRELLEETGIGRDDIRLFRLMDMTYYQQGLVLEIYVGMLHKDTEMTEEVNPLEWISIHDDFADSGKYAGDKNIAHIVEMALMYDVDRGADAAHEKCRMYAAYHKSIIDQDRCAVVICNLRHEIIYMNPAAVANYANRGGIGLIGQNILNCHNAASQQKIRQVVEWFAESEDHNMVYTYYNEKQNKDVYMVALRSEGRLIGYYEKHEFRTKETMKPYDF